LPSTDIDHYLEQEQCVTHIIALHIYRPETKANSVYDTTLEAIWS